MGTSRGIIILSGSLAQRPGHGGHAWVLLQYLLGFRRLGWNVLFLDELQSVMCVDEDGAVCPLTQSYNLRYFLDVMHRFALEESFSLICGRGEHTIGLAREQVLERVRRSALLINVMGYLSDEEILAAAPRRVFLDIDPGFGQMWRDLGLADIFAGHDAFVTIGENIGADDCGVPTCGLNWLTTPQPIVLEHWPIAEPQPNGAFTSIASWRGPFGPIEYKGKTHGLRVHEFRRFVTLPSLTTERFELAMNMHASDQRDIDLLDRNGWRRVDPRQAASTVADYQRYIAGSKAEFMVAKNLYVDTRGGWFSDRSICYLASGRPVLVQNTGISRFYPTGKGLLTFATLEQAVAGVEAINRDYPQHALAARAIAQDYFDSDKVLSRLLQQLQVM